MYLFVQQAVARHTAAELLGMLSPLAALVGPPVGTLVALRRRPLFRQAGAAADLFVAEADTAGEVADIAALAQRQVELLDTGLRRREQLQLVDSLRMQAAEAADRPVQGTELLRPLLAALEERWPFAVVRVDQ